MASMVAKASASSTTQISPAMSVQEKGSRNKRKFRADPPLMGDPNKNSYQSQNECPNFEFSAEKFELTLSNGRPNACDMCSMNHEHSDALKLDLGLSNVVGSSDISLNRPKEEVEASGEFHDTDWSDFTESQLEELVLSNLDAIFRSALKKIVACGYTEEVATKAVLRSGLCYGCKDTVSNIVDNTLAYLRSGQETDAPREHYFEDLQQMEKYILAELVCVLREVRPFFSTGDAMWCLLICDMNVSHACAMDGDMLSDIVGEGAPIESSSANPQSKTEVKNSEINILDPRQQNMSMACNHSCPEAAKMVSIPCAQSSQLETTKAVGASNLAKPIMSLVPNGLVPKKETPNSTSDTVDKSFSVAGTSQSPVPEEKFGSSRKTPGISKRDYMLRQKSLHPEKTYRTYGSRGSSRAGKLNGFGGLMLDKKLKSVAESAGINMRSSSLKMTRALGVDVPQDDRNNQPVSTVAFNFDAVSASNRNVSSESPIDDAERTLSAADTELSLSLTPKSNVVSLPANSNFEAPTGSQVGVPYDKSPEQWMSRDKKDEIILKLVPRVKELQNQLEEWTEWANQKVMQAARRLSKDKAELKLLRQEKEELERLKKEKQALEENTMKKLSEMENALCKAGGQVERANSAVRRLEVENAALRREMEAAKLRAAESAISCQEVLKREKKTLTKFQSWEKQKIFFQEELVAEKRKLTQLQQELEQAKDIRDQLEARWKQEEKAKEELLIQAGSIKKDREQIEASAKSKEDLIKMKAENSLQRYKDNIEKLEKDISQLRLKSDSSKIAALRRGIDGSYASRLTDTKNSPSPKEDQISSIYRLMKDLDDDSANGGVKRERECVMCLSEEMSVVFLPCAHQVVCTSCNELHEKQGMKECPSCRSTIQRRICVRYARS